MGRSFVLPLTGALGVPVLCVALLTSSANATPDGPTVMIPAGASIARLLAVTAVSPTDAWAVGDVQVGSKTATLVEHWDGASWQRVASPNPRGYVSTSLSGVTAVSADDVWAVGTYLTRSSGRRTLILHWNGTRWSQVPSPNVSESGDNVLVAVGATARDDAWAVGWHTSPDIVSVTFTEHWDGDEWSVELSPNPSHKIGNVLSGVSGVSAKDVWAVGSFAPSASRQSTLVAHWNGKHWARPISPSPGDVSNELLAVSARASKDVWAVGDYSDSPGEPFCLIEHWNGRRWSRVPGPDLAGQNSVLTGVSLAAENDGWAVGYVESGGVQQTLTLRWDGNSWTQVPSPNPGVFASTLRGVDAGGPNAVWAVGSAFASANVATELITSWDGVGWHVMADPRR